MNIREWWDSCSEEESAYLLAGGALGFCVLANVVMQRLDLSPLNWAYLLPLLFFIYGFAQFIEGLWESARKSILVKVANSILFIVGSGSTVSLSAMTVNWALQVPSSAFPHTQAMAALLCLPIVLLIALPIASLLTLPLLMPLSLLEDFPGTIKEIFSISSLRKKSKPGDTVVIARFIGMLMLLPVSFAALSLIGPYSEWVADISRWYAHNVEAEKYSHCRMKIGQKIAYINGDYVVRTISKGDDYIFEMGLCDSPLNQRSEAHKPATEAAAKPELKN